MFYEFIINFNPTLRNLSPPATRFKNRMCQKSSASYSIYSFLFNFLSYFFSYYLMKALVNDHCSSFKPVDSYFLGILSYFKVICQSYLFSITSSIIHSYEDSSPLHYPLHSERHHTRSQQQLLRRRSWIN